MPHPDRTAAALLRRTPSNRRGAGPNRRRSSGAGPACGSSAMVEAISFDSVPADSSCDACGKRADSAAWRRLPGGAKPTTPDRSLRRRCAGHGGACMRRRPRSQHGSTAWPTPERSAIIARSDQCAAAYGDSAAEHANSAAQTPRTADRRIDLRRDRRLAASIAADACADRAPPKPRSTAGGWPPAGSRRTDLRAIRAQLSCRRTSICYIAGVRRHRSRRDVTTRPSRQSTARRHA